jgi:excisionase family DNA binding protein
VPILVNFEGSFVERFTLNMLPLMFSGYSKSELPSIGNIQMTIINREKDNKYALLKVSEVASILRIQRAKVYILIEDKTLHGIKVGNTWRISKQSVDKLININ